MAAGKCEKCGKKTGRLFGPQRDLCRGCAMAAGHVKGRRRAPGNGRPAVTPGDIVKAAVGGADGEGVSFSGPLTEEQEANIRIAAISEFATAIGLTAVPLAEGLLYRTAGGRMIVLDRHGRLRHARLDIGEAL